jgi:hypothetical protein
MKIFQKIFLTVHKTCGAVIGGNLAPIGAKPSSLKIGKV